MNAADLRALRDPLIVMMIVLAACAAVNYYLSSSLKTATQELAQQENQLRAARARLHTSGDEKQIIVRYLNDYQWLQRLGFVGDEQRINWLDGLRIANQQADLFGVAYQIGTQAPYAYAAQYNPGQIALNQSVMRLDFRLLHEADLMRFLTALSRQGGGIFAVDQCMLKRIDNRGVIRYQPNLTAECDLSWITAKVGAPVAEPKPKS